MITEPLESIETIQEVTKEANKKYKVNPFAVVIKKISNRIESAKREDKYATEEEIKEAIEAFRSLDIDEKDRMVLLYSSTIEDIAFNYETKKIYAAAKVDSIPNLLFKMHGIVTSSNIYSYKNCRITDLLSYCEDKYEVLIADAYEDNYVNYLECTEYNHPNGYSIQKKWKPFREKMQYIVESNREMASDEEIEFLIKEFNSLHRNDKQELIFKFQGAIVGFYYSKETNKICVAARVGPLFDLLFVVHGFANGNKVIYDYRTTMSDIFNNLRNEHEFFIIEDAYFYYIDYLKEDSFYKTEGAEYFKKDF